MKLELFDFVENTLQLIDNNREYYSSVGRELREFFRKNLEQYDDLLNVIYRIKAGYSLREKMLRMNYYSKYCTPENLIDDLSDIIGIRLECRFIRDEEETYDRLKLLFSKRREDGLYECEFNEKIALDLDEPQPMKQKNGFEIYKIDGFFYDDNDRVIRFEVQIKSLVNIFWGEIDHRVLYKNFNYILKERFFKDIMSSIKESLYMIDRELMLVFEHLNSMNPNTSDESKKQLQSLMSKSIYDIYIEKVRNEMGFVLDFKSSTDLIVSYLFMKDKNGENNYGKNFLRLLNRLGELENSDLRFNEYIEFEREISFHDFFTRQIGYKILGVINKDFRWNLFFKIIFDIEKGVKADDFEGFIIFLRYRFFESLSSIDYSNMREDQKNEIRYFVLEQIIESFCKDISIDFISEFNLNKLNRTIEYFLSGIVDYEDWMNRRMDLRELILNCEYREA